MSEIARIDLIASISGRSGVSNGLLMESGNSLLLESGSFMLL